LNRNPKLFLGLLIPGLLVLFVASCGNENVVTAPCTNCSFWEMAYGGVGRFPAVSPDPAVIAFVSTYQFPEKIEYPFDPGDLGVGQYEHIWLARTEEDISDTVWYYQITYDEQDDFLPAWSPGGDLIAFERNIGREDERQIFVVDVTDPENPGVPQQVTDSDLKPSTGGAAKYRNGAPSWVNLGGKTWLSFVNYPKGASDFDIGLLSWDDLGDTVWVSIDPADFAAQENGVMSYTFKDTEASSNFSNLIAFASPDRRRVGDIRVVARTQEREDSSFATEIFVDGKSSGKYTPYTFRYRPAGLRVRITSTTAGYCTQAGDTLVTPADTTRVFLIDFRHTKGTLGVSASHGDLFVYMDGDQQFGPAGVALKTSKDPNTYVYISCVDTGTVHSLFTEDVFGNRCGDAAQVTVAAGETTLVHFECGGSWVSEGGGVPSRAALSAGYGSDRGAGNEAALLAQQTVVGIWLVDTGDDAGIADDHMYLVDGTSRGASYPVISPDGKYVAYFRGTYTSWEIVIADISGLLSGTGNAVLTTVGLPGSSEEIECWREPEKISWVPMQDGAKIVVSLSPCRGGNPDETGIWIADLSKFIR
jgi:hypothetical protein